jgi:ATP-binding cassette subfamily C (CFTR/MRP) protein 4
MPVGALRSKFTVIPQTPFLFSDTLRRNLDPFDEHPEAEIVESLQAVKIWEKLLKVPLS